MRLQRALPINAIDTTSGFGDREERQEKRAERIRRRARRKAEKRRERAKLLRARARAVEAKNPARAARLRARADKLDPRPRRPKGRAAPPAQLQPLQPETQQFQPSEMEQPEDAEMEQPPEEGDPEAEEGTEMEGSVGLAWSRRRTTAVARWSPPAAMGSRIRIQAASGYRAAVIELRPGLFIVAEVPEPVTRPAFGLVPLLAPLVVRAAKNAIDNPEQSPRQKRGPLAALFQRRQQQKALPGPAPAAASTALVPADAETERAAAAVGRWVGADDLAGVIADCEGCRR